MNAFSKKNLQRCQSPEGFDHKLEDWSLSDWMTAVVGELGEAANIIKKLNRIRDGVPGNTTDTTLHTLMDQLAEELADTHVYLDLLMQAASFDPEVIVERKFKKTSVKIGYQE